MSLLHWLHTGGSGQPAAAVRGSSLCDLGALSLREHGHESTCSIEDLPDELLARVFALLKPFRCCVARRPTRVVLERRPRQEGISRHWRRVLLGLPCSASLHFGRDPVMPEVLAIRDLIECRNVVQLSLRSARRLRLSGQGGSWLALPLGLPHGLRSLEADSQCLELAWWLLERGCPALERLSLSCQPGWEEGAWPAWPPSPRQLLAQQLPRMHSLRQLTLAGWAPDAVLQRAVCAAPLTALTAVALLGARPTEALALMPCLRSLALTVELYQEGQLLDAALPSLSQLTSLELLLPARPEPAEDLEEEWAVAADLAVLLPLSLPSLPAAASLRRLTVRGVERAPLELWRCGQLTALRLEGNSGGQAQTNFLIPPTDAGSYALGSLRELSLSACGVVNQDAFELAEGEDDQHAHVPEVLLRALSPAAGGALTSLHLGASVRAVLPPELSCITSLRRLLVNAWEEDWAEDWAEDYGVELAQPSCLGSLACLEVLHLRGGQANNLVPGRYLRNLCALDLSGCLEEGSSYDLRGPTGLPLELTECRRLAVLAIDSPGWHDWCTWADWEEEELLDELEDFFQCKLMGRLGTLVLDLPQGRRPPQLEHPDFYDELQRRCGLRIECTRGGRGLAGHPAYG